MYTMEMKGTKWVLFTISVDLFATKGYNDVSMRDIAEATGIKAASIYNHFKSKEDILQTIYAFYHFYYNFFLPPLDTLLDYVGTEPPEQTLKRTLFRFDPAIQDIMDKIFLIASMRLYCDKKAQELVFQNIYISTEKYLSTLLNRMIEIKLIEPLDISSFILTITSLCHSAALRMRTDYPIEWEVWVRSIDILYGRMIKLSLSM